MNIYRLVLCTCSCVCAQVIDPVVPRFTALLASEAVLVNVAGATDGVKQVAKHPKVTLQSEIL